MAVLVTGGAGFIGSALVARLLARGDVVHVLDDLSTGRMDRLPPHPHLHFVKGDICDAGALQRVLTGVDVAFHHAAIASVAASVADPARSMHVSAVGTARLLEVGRATGLRRVVFASSSAVYGDDAPVPTPEEAPLAPRSPYAVGKASAEALLRCAGALYGIDAVVLRYFNVYGAGQDPKGDYAAAIPRFVTCLQDGQSPTFFGDGRQTRDFCHVSDVVEANLAAAAAPSAMAGRAFNVGTGRPIDLWALWAALGEAGAHQPPARSPVVAPARAGDVRHSTADVRRAGDELGWTARVALATGLRDLFGTP